jgi:protease PrsW
MGLLLSLFFGFVPMLMFAWFVNWLDRYEKEPKTLLGIVFLWGAVVAAGAAFVINTVLGIGVFIFTESEAASMLTTASLIAPIVEESLKGMAVLFVFLLFRRDFDSILDGIVYAGIVALGFAATENTYYIFTYGYLPEGLGGLFFLSFVRVILVGWQHPFFTSFIGIGLAVSRLSRRTSAQVLAPVVGWSIAVFAHSFHNTLASLLAGAAGLAFATLIDWSGWAIMFLFILWAIGRERRILLHQLREEVTLGNITPVQYQTVCSAWSQSAARLKSLLSHRYTITSRFYQACGELAHKKQHRARLGEEGGNTEIIEQLRSEVAHLSPLVIT